MKKLFFLLSFLLLFVPLAEVNAKEMFCPNLNELEKTTIEDRDELLQALKTLIPSTYEGRCDGFARCALAARNPLTVSLKPYNGYAHHIDVTDKVGNHNFISNIYEKGEEASLFSEWKIITTVPFPKTSGKDHIYYEMAQNFCGREIADRSWLVRISFPKWEGKSASMSEGQIFVAKRKDDEWFVWFQYH